MVLQGCIISVGRRNLGETKPFWGADFFFGVGATSTLGLAPTPSQWVFFWGMPTAPSHCSQSSQSRPVLGLDPATGSLAVLWDGGRGLDPSPRVAGPEGFPGAAWCGMEKRGRRKKKGRKRGKRRQKSLSRPHLQIRGAGEIYGRGSPL